MTVRCELSDNAKRIEVWFPYNPAHVASVKTVAGARFVPKDKSYNGLPHWTVAKDMETARALRRAFGKELELGPKVRVWAAAEVGKDANLRSLALASTAELSRLPKVLPELYQAIHVGPRWKGMGPKEREEAMSEPASFQAADIAFGVQSPNPLNGNQPGLGKTLETIGSIFEEGTDNGPQLVVAPKSALEATWKVELERWQPHPVYVSTGSAKAKRSTIERFAREIVSPGKAGWLIVNPDQVRFREEIKACPWHLAHGTLKREVRACSLCQVNLVSEFPLLHTLIWNNVIVDEAHKNAVRNPKTLTAKGMYKLQSRKSFGLTGTPMGGKVINLWGLLHFLNAETFSSKWRWAETWTDIQSNGFGKTIGSSIKHCPVHFGIEDDAKGRPDCKGCREIEEAFYRMLEPYIIRRTKAEALPYLPAKDHIELWCGFGSDRHEKQYRDFQADAEVMIADETISATSILAEYTRLKQFSGFRHEIVNGRLVPTTDSGKLEMLQEKLEELGIWDGEGNEQAVIFSQFSQVVDLIVRWLEEAGVPVAKITGATNRAGQRAQIQQAFQSGAGPRVLVMTTTAGGVSITLDRASNVFILDETWDPDDQEQAEDRCHRASRIHQVTIYNLRTRSTIEEAIAVRTFGKAQRNLQVLDLRRLVGTGAAPGAGR